MENKNENKPATPTPGDQYDIPVQGSLGLLALGYKGLKLWREKKAQVAAKKEVTEKNNIK